jgi:hypothetical protein
MKQASKEWTKINNRIRTCLRQAATKCFEQDQITANEYDDFFISGRFCLFSTFKIFLQS